MAKDLKECNRLYVLELTGDLRTSSNWSALRNAILGKGLQLDVVALPFFGEDEYGNEFGLLVSLDSVFEFQFNEGLNAFKKWSESKEPDGVYGDSLQEVQWTREMLSNGNI